MRYFREVITYFLTCCLFMNTSLQVALALEQGDVLSSSGATPTQWGDHTIIDTDHGSIIDWRNFNTSDTQSVKFNQYLNSELSSSSAVLNRISSGTVPTQFNGALNANGRVFVVNPAGVMFGGDSIVNVTQLVASGLGMSNEAFDAVVAGSASQMVFGEGSGVVRNEGTITAGSVFLVGKKVINAGSIFAPDGLVVMAAGDNVYIAQDGSNVVVEVLEDPLDTTADVQNRSLINATNGTIVLAAGDTFSRAITNVGWLAASAGTVTAHAAVVENRGVIKVDAMPGDDVDGGNVTLTAVEEVLVGPDGLGVPGRIHANGGQNGNGGQITLESGGAFNMNEGTLIEAKGGSVSGDGGSVKITCDHFTIAGEIDASPTNGEPGTLWIDPPVDVTIANGGNLGELDTLYEEDVETLSQTGTSIIVEAEDSITVENMLDGEITGGSGDIVLRNVYNTGGINFLPATEGGPVTTQVTTTSGDIYILAGSGGITTGDLHTSENNGDNPGRIMLFTNNGGSIETGAMSVDGGNEVEVSIVSSGDLTIDGSVMTSTNKVPDENQEGTARICLISETGDINIDGAVEVEAHGKFKTSARIHICADNTVTVNTGNGRVRAWADTAGNTGTETAEAEVKIHAGSDEPGAITVIRPVGGMPVRARASIGGGGVGPLESTGEVGTVEETNGGAHALIEIADAWTGECPDCPTPPVIPPPIVPEPIGLPDFEEAHMGTQVTGNVLTNDDESLTTVVSNTDPSHGTLVMNSDGSFTYTPDEAGYVGGDSFTYTATDGEHTTGPITVTITMNNLPPTPFGDATSTHMGTEITINISDLLINDTDPDSDAVSFDSFDYTGSGTLTDNGDGTLTYKPNDGYVGDDTFTYKVTDPQIDGTPVSTSVTITMSNDLPSIIGDDIVTTVGNPPVTGNVLSNDTDLNNDLLHVDSYTQPGHGTVTINPDGTFTYTPDKSFVGEDSFTYSASDGQMGVEPTGVTVTITVNPEPVAAYMPAAPGLERRELEISGCPALINWTAAELGTNEGMVQVWMANALASSRDIQPCDTCANLKQAAAILQDPDGERIAALALVINEYASSTTPPTEEQMASIANAIAQNTETDNQYALAGEYLDALALYVGILNSELNFSAEESVQVATNNYVGQLAEGENVGLTAYVAARLAALGG